jgi:hypothetical protein
VAHYRAGDKGCRRRIGQVDLAWQG